VHDIASLSPAASSLQNCFKAAGKTLITRKKWSLIRHRFRPFSAGAWHFDHLRVLARPRGAMASRSG